MDRNECCDTRRLRDRSEVLCRVVWHFLVHRRIHRERTRRHEERIAVRFGFRDDVVADDGARASAILGNYCDAEALRKALRKHAPDQIVAAAWRGGNHDAYAARRVCALSKHVRGHEQRNKQRNRAATSDDIQDFRLFRPMFV
jgi:hypothetical protein